VLKAPSFRSLQKFCVLAWHGIALFLTAMQSTHGEHWRSSVERLLGRFLFSKRGRSLPSRGSPLRWKYCQRGRDDD
jgi:hypothetical protein